MQELKRLGRYLVKNKRCVLTYARQTSDETLKVHVDSDWAGDLLGRKITTGVIVRRGKHLLRHMSCLQTLVALSSGEAEYYALIRGACTSLGIQSHYQDWMIDVPIQIYSDSPAARSVARSVKSIPPNTENSTQYGSDENDNNNMSNETKCETNYSINNKWNNKRNKHLTKHDTNDDVDLDNCVVHTVR